MVYVCVICMCPCSLEFLSAEHREILECLVSTCVNLVELQNVKLLVCRSCVSLVKALVKFKQTAIAGVTHLLHLRSKQKKVVEPDEVLIKDEPSDNNINSIEIHFNMELVPEFPDEVLIKDEPSDNNINSIEIDFNMELVPEFVNIEDVIKVEQDILQSETTQNWDNIEEPMSTIKVTSTNTGVVIDQNKKNNNNDNNIRVTEVPLLHQTEKTAVFTHLNASNCNSEPQMQTSSTKIVTDTRRVSGVPMSDELRISNLSPLYVVSKNVFLHYLPRAAKKESPKSQQVCVVQQNLLKTPQDGSRLMNPNLPQFLPYYNKLNKHNTVPVVQNLLSKLKASTVTQPVTFKRVPVRNIKPSNNKVLKEVKIGEITNMLSKIGAEKIAQIVTAKRAGERYVNPRSNSEQPLERVVVEPRWCTRVFSYKKMIMSRAKERRRPEFADEPYKCVSCILVFRSQEEMDAHTKKHVIGPDELPCKVCALPTRPCEEAVHDSTHATRHQCARCTFSTERLDVIEAHDCSAEPGKYTKKKKEYPVQCNICFSRVATEPALEGHIKRKHSNPDRRFECDICNKQFPTKNRLSSHIRGVHEKDNKSKNYILFSTRPELFCTDCNIPFATLSGYRNHRLSLRHTSKDMWKFECDACHRKFPTKFVVKLHIVAKHMSTEVSKCKECYKSFADPYAFRRHVKRHQARASERPRPHVCEVCGRAFMIKKTLTEHMFMHSGQRPYKCKECPDTFTYSAALFMHNRLKHLKKPKNDKIKKSVRTSSERSEKKPKKCEK